jgi:hypothetical protein
VEPTPTPSAATAPDFAHPRALHAWTVVVFSAAVLAAVVVGMDEAATISLVALAVFAVLCAAAEHVAVVMPNQSSCSVSVMVCLAAVVVFRADAPLFGPLLVGMASGIYLPHVLKRDWMRLALNTGMFGLATLAAAAAYGSIATASSSTTVALVGATAAASAYWFTNMTLLAVTLSLRDGTSFRYEFFALWGPAELQIVIFAILGLGLGLLYESLGTWTLLMFVVPVLIARQVFASYLALRQMHQAILDTLVVALEAKDPYTGGHVTRVAMFAGYIGVELGFSPKRLRLLHDAALLHDIGKLIVSNQLLNKPGKLTAAEFEEVKRHEGATVEMMQHIDELAPSADAVAHTGLAAPIESRIIHVADAYDAMTSTRAYRRALTHDAAVEELRANSGVQFDPECVTAMIAALDRRGERHGAGLETDSPHFETAPVAGVGSAGLGDLAPEPA